MRACALVIGVMQVDRMLTRRFADKSTRGLSVRGLGDSRIMQLAEWRFFNHIHYLVQTLRYVYVNIAAKWL